MSDSTFTDEQLTYIHYIATNFKSSIVSFWTNLFLVLHLNVDIELCKKTRRFQYRDRDGNQYSRETIYDCLINNSKVDALKIYIRREYRNMIDIFKDHKLIKKITKYEYDYLFKTTDGYLYISNTNTRKAEMDSYGNVIQLNMKDGVISSEKPIVIKNPSVTEDDKKKGITAIVDKRNPGELYKIFENDSFKRAKANHLNGTIVFYNKCKRCSYDVPHDEVLYDESKAIGKIVIKHNPPSCSKCGNIKRTSPFNETLEIDNKYVIQNYDVDISKIFDHEHKFTVHKLISYQNLDKSKNARIYLVGEDMCVDMSGELNVEYELTCDCGRIERRKEVISETNNPFDILKHVNEDFMKNEQQSIRNHRSGICPLTSKPFDILINETTNYERNNDWETFYWKHHFHYCNQCKFVFKDESEYIQDYCMKPSKRTAYTKVNHDGKMKIE